MRDLRSFGATGPPVFYTSYFLSTHNRQPFLCRFQLVAQSKALLLQPISALPFQQTPRIIWEKTKFAYQLLGRFETRRKPHIAGGQYVGSYDQY